MFQGYSASKKWIRLLIELNTIEVNWIKFTSITFIINWIGLNIKITLNEINSRIKD